MKVIGFIASPRSGSNTGILVDEVLKGASEVGAETKSFDLTKLTIAPCTACMYCKQNDGQCCIDDDMQELYNELDDADAIIIGSPVYFGEVSAQTKPFIDRQFATFSMDIDEDSKKRMALVFSQGNEDVNAFSNYFDYMKNIFGISYNVVDVLVSTGNQIPGDVENKKDDLGKAKEIGEKLVNS